ncbi:hypothetical protein B0T13DRAFT_462600 [Neurospora crassa]|nr:hypothetical protein B0T13DRAFT_462600 [Neurospora crassa]
MSRSCDVFAGGCCFCFLFSQAGQRSHYPAPPFPLFACLFFSLSFHLVNAFLDPV